MEKNGVSKQTYQVTMLAVTLLVLADQVRTQPTDHEKDMQLVDSIRQHGIIQALGVRPFEGKYKVVFGHRRYRCGVAAGLEKVPCVVLDKDIQESEVMALQITENLQRADLSDFDKWQGFAKLLELNHALTQNDLAKELSQSPANISKYMSVGKLSPAWREALKAGKVTVSDCAVASKAAADQHDGLLALKLSGNLTREQLAGHVKSQRNGVPAPEAVTQAKIRHAITLGRQLVVTGPPVGLAEYVDVLVLALEQARKALKDKLDIKTAERVWSDKSKGVPNGAV